LKPSDGSYVICATETAGRYFREGDLVRSGIDWRDASGVVETGRDWAGAIARGVV